MRNSSRYRRRKRSSAYDTRLTAIILTATSFLAFLVGRGITVADSVKPTNPMAQFGQIKSKGVAASAEIGVSALVLGEVEFVEQRDGPNSNLREPGALRKYSASSRPIGSIVVSKDLIQTPSQLLEFEFQADDLGSYVLRLRPKDIAVLYAIQNREREPLSFTSGEDMKGGNYEIQLEATGVRLGEEVLIPQDLRNASLRLNTNLSPMLLHQIEFKNHRSESSSVSQVSESKE